MRGLLARLLGRASKLPIDQVVSAIERIAALAGHDRELYRAMLQKAVAAGDLDAPIDAFRAANRAAEDYIKKG